jgi:hypothetical protein
MAAHLKRENEVFKTVVVSKEHPGHAHGHAEK